jgi:hypothetical protein
LIEGEGALARRTETNWFAKADLLKFRSLCLCFSVAAF